jgi:transcriptional regulator with XRE-family HTH domain
MNIGPKIKNLRVSYGLTQEELAIRCELSKGFISQLENDLTSPSLVTLTDILEVLGSSLADFFKESKVEKVDVHKANDYFVKSEEGQEITWLISDAQNKGMEPVKIKLSPGHSTFEYDAHESELFGYVLEGEITIVIGTSRYICSKGDSFYIKDALNKHYVYNESNDTSEFIWVSNPPIF